MGERHSRLLKSGQANLDLQGGKVIIDALLTVFRDSCANRRTGSGPLFRMIGLTPANLIFVALV